MIQSVLVFLAGCAPLSTDCSPSALEGAPAASSAGSAGVAPDCAEAEALAESYQAGIDTLAAERDRAWFAANTLVEMQAMAVRSANEPLAGSAREAFVLDFDQHRSELETAGASDPALHPDALGLSRSRVDHESYASQAVEDLEGALDSTIDHIAAFEVNIGAAERAAEQGLAPYAECALTVEADNRDPIDRDALPDAARVTNLDEGLGVVAAARTSNDQAIGLLNRIRRLAIAAASESTDSQRAAIQAEFEGLCSELQRIADTTRFNDQAISNGTRVTEVVFVDPGPAGAIDVVLGDLSPTTLGVDTGSLDLTTASSASAAIDAIDQALWAVGDYTTDLDVAMLTLEVERDRLVD